MAAEKEKDPAVAAMRELRAGAAGAPSSSQQHLAGEGPATPQDSASWLSKVYFWWLTPLLELGRKRPLEEADLYRSARAELAENTSAELAREWAAGRERAAGASLGGALWRIHRRYYLWSALMYAVYVVSLLLGPTLVKGIVEWAEAWQAGRTTSTWEGYRFALALFGAIVAGSLGQAHSMHNTNRLLVRVRSALIARIFHKAMRLSNGARRAVSSGAVVNLMSSDAQRFADFAPGLQYAWASPLLIVAGVTLLAVEVGAGPAFAGFGAMLLFLPVAGKLTARQVQLQRETLALTDRRVNMTKEVLQGVRVVKYYAWEKPFLGALNALRAREVDALRRYVIIKAISFSSLIMIPFVGAAVTFLVFSATGGEMTASTVFASVALIQVIRFPFLFLPLALNSLVQLMVSLRRIEKFLRQPEVGDGVEPLGDGEVGVRVEDADFGWYDADEAGAEEAGAAGAAEAGEKKTAAAATAAAAARDGDEAKQDDDGAAGGEEEEEAKDRGPVLRNVTLEAARGELVAVVGPVACGKSTLISGLLGDAVLLRGRTRVGGRVALVPQSAFIVHASVKDNVVFGLPYDEARYQRVVEACQLRADIEMLPRGDRTEIGERGINLSGGQKQRVSMARAAYQVLAGEADLVLLDDPLSALDAHVGKRLFEECVLGLLGGTTRILVTHSLQYLQRTDRVAVLGRAAAGGGGDGDGDGDGSSTVVACGAYADLMADTESTAFAALMEAFHAGHATGVRASEADEAAAAAATTSGGGADLSDVELDAEEASKAEKKADRSQGAADGGLVEKEDMERGNVDAAVYRAYFMVSGFGFALLCLAAFLVANMSILSGDLWLALWTSDVDNGDEEPLGYYMSIYLALVLLSSLALLARSLLVATLGLRASAKLHGDLLGAVLRKSMRFFDTTPVGRLLNRFGADLYLVDNNLSQTIEHSVATFVGIIFTLLLIAAVAPVTLVVFFVLAFVLYHVQLNYRKSSREMQRLEAVTRSPIFSHFTEALGGTTTIRALRRTGQYERANLDRINTNQRPFYLFRASGFWLRLRLDALGAVVVAAAVTALVGQADVTGDGPDPGLVGLVVAYSLSITNTLNWAVILSTRLEAMMSSTERILHYSSPDDEEQWEAADPEAERAVVEAGAAWPPRGGIEFVGVTARYAPQLDNVLSEVTFSVPPGSRVGIVGRTGSGKSSLFNAVFRTFEVCGGRIEIDGLDTAALSLETLRSSVALIPQDPVMFVGSVRFNLDPFLRHTDEELWGALELVQLDAAVRRMPEQLDEQVEEGGDNLSVGQRQLLCLARAVLRRPRILALDEATASVDHETDAQIQRLVRERFENCTILTIAHRLATIIDYDRIVVLDAGRVVQFGTPDELRADRGGQFFEMLAGSSAEKKAA